MSKHEEEIVRRAHYLVEQFKKDPSLQKQVIDQLQRDGIIDENGQVICLGKLDSHETPANGIAK